MTSWRRIYTLWHHNILSWHHDAQPNKHATTSLPVNTHINRGKAALLKVGFVHNHRVQECHVAGKWFDWESPSRTGRQVWCLDSVKVEVSVWVWCTEGRICGEPYLIEAGRFVGWIVWELKCVCVCVSVMHRRADLWGALFDRGRQVWCLDSVRVEVCVCVSVMHRRADSWRAFFDRGRQVWCRGEYKRMCACVCKCVCVYACVCIYLRACVCLCCV